MSKGFYDLHISSFYPTAVDETQAFQLSKLESIREKLFNYFFL